MVNHSGHIGYGVAIEHGMRMETRYSQTRLLGDRLQTFLEEEDRKCQNYEHPLPGQTFFAPPIQQSLMNMGKHASMFAKFLVSIASTETLVTLRQIVIECRESPSPMSFRLRSDVSKRERFDLITSLGGGIAWYRLLRMYHVLELYKDCGGMGCTERLILTTPATFQNRTQKAGNPLHAAQAHITEGMMAEIFPRLLPGTDAYNEKKASLKPVRKLGERLHMLVAKFGEGVLGLMLNDDMKCPGVSEHMITGSPDGAFAKFLEILDLSQGDLLCDFSDAVQKILDPLIHDKLPSEPFEIEKQPQDRY
ncbi:hypothetical protein N7451_012582 [Penicillium sp. IBT 35674x]|nr:hypothetical protein N7451_012582 [Penicillium sp. IBT 35674x]